MGVKAASHQSYTPASGAPWGRRRARGLAEVALRHRPGLGGGDSGLGGLKRVGDPSPGTERFEWQLGMWYTNLREPVEAFSRDQSSL